MFVDGIARICCCSVKGSFKQSFRNYLLAGRYRQEISAWCSTQGFLSSSQTGFDSTFRIDCFTDFEQQFAKVYLQGHEPAWSLMRETALKHLPLRFRR